MTQVFITYLPQILLLGVLLILAAFFSAAETAISAASLPRMVSIARDKKSPAAKLAVGILENKERLITVMLLCNNLLNIFLASYFTYFMTSMFGVRGLAIAASAMGAVMVIFTEIIPKNIAVYMANKIVLSLAYPLVVVSYITRPLTWLIEGMNRAVIWLFRLKKDHAGERDDELRGVIEMQEESDAVEKHEKLMLQSILDLADNALDSAMTYRNSVEMISTAWPLKKMLAAISQSRYGHLPLYQDDPDKIIGVFHTKEVLKKNLWQNGLTKKQLIKLADKPWFVPISTTLAHQLQAFRKVGNHFAIVIDEYGVFKGVVTLEDILSEIVGDIENIGQPKKEMMQTDDGSVVAMGTVTVRNLNREYGWDLPEEGVNTIAGLLLREAKIVPEVGVGITAFGFHFVVLALEKQQIKKIKIKKIKIKKTKRKIGGLLVR
ncbi:MAG: CNNM domain-containing protein [Hydrotalea sp.]|nr:CNNM domain-containing protein [Hydrotalea sp.]